MKPLTTLLAGGLTLLLAACQHSPSPHLTAAGTGGADNQAHAHVKGAVDPATIALETDALFAKLVTLRRDLHQHPELAGKEARTAARIATHLRALGLEVHSGHHGHSVVGILRGGQPGQTIAWRAELDALAGDFRDPADFKSRTPGVHHACGHDVHIAIALGLAEMLVNHRAQLHGTAVFIFQPEEETFVGAKAMLERGALASVPPQEIYGLHVTALPVGQIVVRENEMFSYQRRVSIRLKSGLPAAEVEPLVQRVRAELSRTRPGAKPWELHNAGDPVIGLTAPDTAFQDYLIMDPSFDTRTEHGELVLEANLYETTASRLAGILPRIERVISDSSLAGKLVSVSFVQESPTVQNNPRLTQLAMRALQQAGGAGAVAASYGQAPFFNDDFAYFQQQIPGVYFFLGGSNASKGLIAMNHAPDFQVDEESIRVGVKRFSALLLARLSSPQAL